MAFGDFVVEDGTGLSDATSYVTVAEATAYCTSHQQYQAVWALLTNEQRESALMHATRWIDDRYRWLGRAWRTGNTENDTAQALRWPRYLIFDEDGRELVRSSDDETVPLPARLKEATIEAALMHVASAVNVFTAEGQSSQGPIASLKADTLEIAYSNATDAATQIRNPDKQGSRTRYITAILDGLISKVGVTR